MKREDYEREMKGADDLYRWHRRESSSCEDDVDHSLSTRLEKAIEAGRKVVSIRYPEEMARTEPPKNCQSCSAISDSCANYPVQDNRMELYRFFGIVSSDLEGTSIFVCKKCLITAFSREVLYDISNPFTGKVRRCFVAEMVRCINCGKSWHWEAREQPSENVSSTSSETPCKDSGLKKPERKLRLLAKPCRTCSE